MKMIEACALQLEQANELGDVSVCILQSDAISAVVKKIKASESVVRRAEMLRINAERRLGEITMQIPYGKRGGAAEPGGATKSKVLASQGLHRSRVNIAEKLSLIGEKQLQKAFEETKTRTVSGVAVQLGLKAPPHWEASKEDRYYRAQILAQQAIGYLDVCCIKGTPPEPLVVDELQRKLRDLGGQNVGGS